MTKKRLRQRSKSITITVIPHEQSQGSERVEQDARSALIGADRGSDRVRPVVTLGNLIKNPQLDTSLQDRRCLKTSNDLHQRFRGYRCRGRRGGNFTAHQILRSKAGHLVPVFSGYCPSFASPVVSRYQGPELQYRQASGQIVGLVPTLPNSRRPRARSPAKRLRVRLPIVKTKEHVRR